MEYYYGSGVMEHSRNHTEHGGLLSNLVATIVMTSAYPSATGVIEALYIVLCVIGAIMPVHELVH